MKGKQHTLIFTTEITGILTVYSEGRLVALSSAYSWVNVQSLEALKYLIAIKYLQSLRQLKSKADTLSTYHPPRDLLLLNSLAFPPVMTPQDLCFTFL